MKSPIFLLLFLVAGVVTAGAATVPTAADWIGKTVMIKTSREGSSCIRLENSNPVVGPPKPDAMDACSFRVMPGMAEGTVAFESVAQPGMYLHHFYFHLVLRKVIDADASFRIVAPLSGDQGISFQSINFPDRHLALIDKGLVDLLPVIKPASKGVFFLEDRKIPFALPTPAPTSTPAPKPAATAAPGVRPSTPRPPAPPAANPGALNPYGIPTGTPVPPIKQ